MSVKKVSAKYSADKKKKKKKEIIKTKPWECSVHSELSMPIPWKHGHHVHFSVLKYHIKFSFELEWINYISINFNRKILFVK